jgi:phage gpG-like protein
MRVEVQNTQAVADALRKYGKDAEREIGRAIDKMGLAVTSDVKRKIQRGPKTGEIYNRRGKQHRASRAGEAPATDTGTLVSSVYTSKINSLTIEVGSRLDYAYYLEFGTVNIDPRPAWIPAIEENRSKFNDWIENALRKAAR